MGAPRAGLAAGSCLEAPGTVRQGVVGLLAVAAAATAQQAGAAGTPGAWRRVGAVAAAATAAGAGAAAATAAGQGAGVARNLAVGPPAAAKPAAAAPAAAATAGRAAGMAAAGPPWLRRPVPLRPLPHAAAAVPYESAPWHPWDRCRARRQGCGRLKPSKSSRQDEQRSGVSVTVLTDAS